MMKSIFVAVCLSAFAGCCNCSKNIQLTTDKIQKLSTLADQIELNDYKLVATNGTLLIMKSR